MALFGDNAATEADVAGIEDGGLAGGGAFDGLLEMKTGVRAFWFDCTVDEWGAVAEADLEAVRVGSLR